MIRSFKGKFAEAVLHGRRIPKGFTDDVAKVQRRKLIMVDSAGFLEALKAPLPATALKFSKAISRASIQSASTISGASFFAGQMQAPKTWRSSIITDVTRPIVATY